MILVKEIELKNEQLQNFEKFLRQFVVRVAKFKEMKATTEIVSSGKEFIGFETERDIKITRVRNSIEVLKPKIYASFPKANERSFYSYKMRLGLWSSITLGLLVLMNLISISNTAISPNHESYPVFIFALLIFLFLMHSETKITERTIRDSFDKLQKDPTVKNT